MATDRQKQPQRFAAAIIFLLLLLGCNYHLVAGGPPSALSYNHAAVLSGEWWRLLTHPLVHVSRYHLILDVLAVAILWQLLPLSSLKKCGAALICGAASLAAAILFSPLIREIGLCGLSGIAHGLMVVCGGLVLRFSGRAGGGGERRTALFGGVLCAVGFGKSVIEVWSSGAIFAGMHGGHLGVPVVEAHLGGALGGLLVLLLFPERRSGEQTESKKCCEK